MHTRSSLLFLALLPACAAEPQPPSASVASVASVTAAPAAAPPALVASVTATPAAVPPASSATGPRLACPPALPILKTESTVWGPLVRLGACWTLANDTHGAPDLTDPLLVQVYDVRKVGGVDVARLKYTLGRNSANHKPLGDVLPQQVAVTAKGVWFLPTEADDAAITAALRNPPTHAAKPKPFEPTAENGYAFVREVKTPGGPIVCAGRDFPRASGKCDGACTAIACFSASNGVVSVEGTPAPSFGAFAQTGFQARP